MVVSGGDAQTILTEEILKAAATSIETILYVIWISWCSGVTSPSYGVLIGDAFFNLSSELTTDLFHKYDLCLRNVVNAQGKGLNHIHVHAGNSCIAFKDINLGLAKYGGAMLLGFWRSLGVTWPHVNVWQLNANPTVEKDIPL